MHRGYTKRWRKRWLKEYHKDRLLWVLMDYFIDHANYKDTEVYVKGAGLVTIKRGQHIFGTLSLADLMGVDRQRIRTKLKILKNINFLTIKPTNRFSIATIINYNTYNPQEETTNQQIDQQLTSHKPATNQQLTTPKEYKKDKKNIYGEFKNVKLTSEEFEKLKLKFNSTHLDRIEALSQYIEQKGKKYKSHYATILTWARKDEPEIEYEPVA